MADTLADRIAARLDGSWVDRIEAGVAAQKDEAGFVAPLWVPPYVPDVAAGVPAPVQMAEPSVLGSKMARLMEQQLAFRFDAVLETVGRDCQSPIEQAFLAALVAESIFGTTCFFLLKSVKVPPSWLDVLNYGREVFQTDEPKPRDLFDRVVLVEAQAPFGAFTADFLLTMKSGHVWGMGRGGDGGPVGQFTVTTQAVIECDGHDYHERTKEQAKHDRRRDRMMQEDGRLVLRFTGSEIWENPSACVRGALRALSAADMKTGNERSEALESQLREDL